MRPREPGPTLDGPRNDLKTIQTMVPYLWPANEWTLKARVVVAVVLLILAKIANVVVPIFYKHAVDALSMTGTTATIIAVPLALLVGYGAARVLSQAFGELRDAVFTRMDCATFSSKL